MSESTMHKSWRDYMQPIIAAVLAAHPDEGPERRAALRKAYPAGERAHHPYKVWLDEIARQTGKKPPLGTRKKAPNPGQLNLWSDEQ